MASLSPQPYSTSGAPGGRLNCGHRSRRTGDITGGGGPDGGGSGRVDDSAAQPRATVIVISSDASEQWSRLDWRTGRSVQGPRRDLVWVRLLRECGEAFDVGCQFELHQLPFIVDA